MSPNKRKREHEDTVSSIPLNQHHNPAIEDRTSSSYTYTPSRSSRDLLQELKAHKETRRKHPLSFLIGESFVPSPCEVAGNMFPEERLQEQLQAMVARHKMLRILTMFQRLLVVLTGFFEDCEAVYQEQKEKLDKSKALLVEYKDYASSHLFLAKELVRERRQR